MFHDFACSEWGLLDSVHAMLRLRVRVIKIRRERDNFETKPYDCVRSIHYRRTQHAVSEIMCVCTYHVRVKRMPTSILDIIHLHKYMQRYRVGMKQIMMLPLSEKLASMLATTLFDIQARTSFLASLDAVQDPR